MFKFIFWPLVLIIVSFYYYALNYKIDNLSYNNRFLLKQLKEINRNKVVKFDGKIRKIQTIELEYIKAIDEMLSCRNIPYFIEGGTLIGAARENGFISWDDDIDYAVLGEENCKKASKLLEKYNITRNRYNQTDMTCAYFIKPELKNELIKEHKIVKYLGRLKRIPLLKNISNYYINHMIQKYTTKEETNLVAFYHYLDGRPSSIYPNYLFENTILPIKKIKFEDTYLNAPQNHDKFLLTLYGDWENFTGDFGRLYHNTYPHVKSHSYFKFTHEELDQFLQHAIELRKQIRKDCISIRKGLLAEDLD